MSGYGEALAAAAERFLGAPFRLHGREAAGGLDCVGLIAAALQATGRRVQAPTGYALRQTDVRWADGIARNAGLGAAERPIKAGDILLCRSGPAQHHLLIASRRGGFVHADARLRRVVHSPTPLPWPVVRHWRLTD